MIEILIAYIDQLIEKQIDQIQCHFHFKTLEASWRGLLLLVQKQPNPTTPPIKIKLLPITLDELQHDLTTKNQVDESTLFDLIYTQEFDQPGGEPISILLGDYFIHLSHVTTLKSLSEIASSAFTPFVCSIDPRLFELTGFETLEPHTNLSRIFSQDTYKNFRALQNQEESAFLSLLLPKILLPKNNHQPLWANPIYAFGIKLCESFHDTGWFYTLTNSEVSLTTALPLHISERQALALAEFGFTSLFQDKYNHKLYLHRIPTLKKMTLQLHHILAVSRFGQTLKILLRNKLGSMNTPMECETFLNQWLQHYSAMSHENNPSIKFKYPLRRATINIVPNPSNPGHYIANIQLEPHHRYETLNIALNLRSEVYNPSWSNNA